ncbi:MAG: aminoacyl-tRNA hydrolase [Gammaproteobacteria bacterium]
MASKIDLIVGLGNPGSEYTQTRHNVGFWFLDELAKEHNITFQAQSKFFGDTARIKTPDQDCWLLKPSTFMNRSGQSVGALATFYRIPIEKILVIHDELDLDPGTLRIKESGGHGGHNGLRDITSRFNSDQYLRIRLGIGHPGTGSDVSKYVLNRPTSTEEIEIQNVISRTLEFMPDILSGNLQKAMNELHRKQD